MSPKPDARRFIERQLAALQKYDLKTNEIVQLSVRQPPRVNGKALTLKTHARTVLLFLAAHAIEHPGDYFTTPDLIFAIESRTRVLGEMRMSWSKPTAEQIYSAVCELRRALRKKKLNVELIESEIGKGYRLSTPAMNIFTDGPDGESLARLAGGPTPLMSVGALVGAMHPSLLQ